MVGQRRSGASSRSANIRQESNSYRCTTEEDLVNIPSESSGWPTGLLIGDSISENEILFSSASDVGNNDSSHIIDIQTKLSERALELLALPEDEPAILLDIGCGSCLSGEVLTENGHTWIGIDISSAMLNIARERECEGDLVLGDIGAPMPFRSGSFDGAISISAVQWLFNSDKATHNPIRRIRTFFGSLYFFVLDVGPGRNVPQALSDESASNSINIVARDRLEVLREVRASKRPPKKSTAWIKHKKEVARQRMKEVAHDSRYTGRKRRPKF
ncbi:unnamed protein product [Dibothriocephalus latus]|uniref:Methyltransferase type 11 domain-containing protein n=1 Tax=Dibothriocephalus latus TaxID=60516 RepID=A0A3P7NMV6_DIBLA|nr:unnamed protein product [Dibothriocephalus latus]